MEDTPFLNIGAEADGDLIEIAAEDRAGPNGGSVVDPDLSRQDHVWRHEGVDGDLREPLTEWNYHSLTSVVPFDPIR